MAIESKRRQTLKALVAGYAGIAGGMWGTSSASAQDKAAVDVTFTLDFTTLGRHAPWYVALGKGYFKDAGLNVKIIPGQGTAQAIQALESDIAQFAFSDVVSLTLARARGASTARFLAMNYQSAPYAIFSLVQGANVTTPAKLTGLEVATGAGSFTPKVVQGFMKQQRLDPASIKFVNVDAAARVGMLLTGKVQSIENFIFAQVGLERAVPPGQLATLLLADHGLEFYANGILAKDAFLKASHDVARAFVKASLQGWRDTIADPEGAATLLARYVQGLNRDVVVGEIKLLSALAQNASTRQHGLGWIDAGRMKTSLDFIAQNIGITGTAPASSDLYSLDFLPRVPA